jgi:hypothetical protein
MVQKMIFFFLLKKNIYICEVKNHTNEKISTTFFYRPVSDH